MDTQNKKISKNREKKEKIVAELSEKVTRAKALVFANYQGMTHVQLEQLKKSIKPANADLVVTKNTLLQKALEISNFQFPISNFQGATATLFAYSDAVLPLKELAKTIKSFKLPIIKFGLAKRDLGSQDIQWEILTAAQVLTLSTLPSREVLLAQFVGGLKSPIFGLHRALQWNLQKFVLTLKAVETKKG